MAEITAALVKDLREKTGAGMMDCKKALAETAGNLEAAVDWLRKKGLAAAAKKASRVAAEGLIGLAAQGTKGVLVEVNSETDFVSRNPQFQAAVQDIAALALSTGGDVEALRNAKLPKSGRNVTDELSNLVATIGENISLRRSDGLSVASGMVATYVHSASGPGIGRIGVLVGLESSAPADKLKEIGHQLAMHVAAANPRAVAPADLDPELIARERAVLVEQAKASGKPDAIIEKMVDGRLRKYYEEVALLEQVWVIDGESKVGKVIEAVAKSAGAPIKITGFRRYALGEGIERKESDFAAEVAAAAKSS
ncbi:MAG: elongation factor Ts [Alphaproteobacteria bacterium]|nr:elongation factor Ts [Alphaproteobacteria bacterium]